MHKRVHMNVCECFPLFLLGSHVCVSVFQGEGVGFGFFAINLCIFYLQNPPQLWL
uniref:Uncharacterized protein n=1 Tax=Anguilla anguilla TaxID=7936 RepID=A0A0E9XWD0_ANGAN